MELRHLRYFLAVAEELHFGRAAARLHIAQPPLSQQIQQLERELDFQLFHRTRRSVELTDAGKIFQREVYGVFERLESGIRKGKLASRGGAGWLSVGFIGSSTYLVLPTILREFRRNYPEVELVLQEIRSIDQGRLLHERRVDVTFARFPKEDERLVFETIYTEELVVALPRSHPSVSSGSLEISALVEEPLILFPHPPSAHAKHTLGLFERVGSKPHVVQTVEEMHAALGLVAAGIGITLVPSSMKNARREEIAYVDLAMAGAELEMKMGFRMEDTSPVLGRFIETVREIYPSGS